VNRGVVALGRYYGAVQEDMCRVLELIRSMYRHEQVTFDQLNRALIRLGLNPDSLYRQLSAGYETPQLNLLAEALGLPEKSLCCMPPQSFGQAMTKLVNQAGSSAAEIAQISQGILTLAEETPQPAQKIPYYQRDKAQWWKGTKRV
jgi:hypothetical protein